MSKGLRVLIADDDDLVADTLARILKLHQIEALAVHSGVEAVAVASTFRPDAAILDVVMHDLNGIEVALAIRQELPGCRIILFSGNEETSRLLAIAAEKGHAFRAFAKPVHPMELLDALGPGPPGLAAD